MKVDILGVKIDNVTMQEALNRVERMVEGGGKHQVVTPNPEHLVMAQKDEEFRQVLNSADLAIPDGIGLVWASRLNAKCQMLNVKKKKKEQALRERVTGTDLMVSLCEKAAAKGWTVFFLGGEEGVAKQAARRLQNQFPGLKVSGTSSADPEHLTLNTQQLPSTDILFVAYGAPTQEKWIAKYLDSLPIKVVVGIGGAFDFVVGRQKRAPRIFRRIGLEWFWRLITQPWRWRRQTRLLRFMVLVMRDVVK